MNRKILIGLLCTLTIMMVVGCGGKKGKTGVASESTYSGEFEGAPSWVLSGGGNMEGGIAVVGSAKIGAAGMPFARNESLADARDQLARQMGTRVANMFKNFTEQIGIPGEDQTVDKVASNISRQVTKQTITGAHQKEAWISPSDTLYVLVAVNPDIVVQSSKEAVKTSLRNEKALYQKFKEKKAFEDFESILDKEFSDSMN